MPTRMLPMKIREGSNIPSWPGLGVRVVAPIANSDSTVIPKKGTKPRAITRGADRITVLERGCDREIIHRSEEHTSELHSLMRISYDVFCLKKKNNNQRQ